jgi:two-component system nitrate/nitrite response regulator NarL
MSSSNIPTILVGGDRLFREGLKKLLSETSLDIVRETEFVREIGAVVAERKSICTAGNGAGNSTWLILLLDFPADEPSLRKLTAGRQAWDDVKIVVLARDPDIGPLVQALDAGVDGYLLRDISTEVLIQSISLVMLGENVFPSQLALRLTHGGNGGRVTPLRTGRPSDLTQRETDILHCLTDGQPNKLIAKRLGVAEATVKVQIRRLLRKIGAANRTQAAIWALGQGLKRSGATAEADAETVGHCNGAGAHSAPNGAVAAQNAVISTGRV